MKINIKEMLKEKGVDPTAAMQLIMEEALGVGQFMLTQNGAPTAVFTGTDEKTGKKYSLTIQEEKS